MTIYILATDRKRLMRSKIEAHGAPKRRDRPVSTGFEGVLRTGTALIAAERTDPSHFEPKCDGARRDAIIGRWEALTGGRPRHAVSARSFDDLAREAEAADAT